MVRAKTDRRCGVILTAALALGAAACGLGAGAGEGVGGAGGAAVTGTGGEAGATGTGGAAPGTGGTGTGGAGTGSGGAGTGGGRAGTGGGQGGSGGARAGTGGAGAGGAGAGTGGAAAGDRCDEAIYDAANPPGTLALTGNLGTHDPSLIAVRGSASTRYYLFQTGRGIPTKVSSNLTAWQGAAAVFSTNPAWITDAVPGATDLWAPDISNFGGVFHLYYAASTFGSNHSCIGHATRAALDSGAWTDLGSVVCSNATATSDNWNAIDPNVAIDTDGTPWLAFGSFWGGIKMVKLTAAGARADSTLYALAARPDAGGAIEAPYIVRRCGYYYLFASFDLCCKGVDSTYKIAVGRATAITGPYADRAGTPMMQGGGTILVQSGTRWRGPGHNAVLFDGGKAYNVYHSYDANANGNPTLRISDLAWDAQGWPISGGP